MIRVLVVDDEALVRDGLVAIVSSRDGLEVVGCAANGVEAVELVEQCRPDVVLMDLRMPILDGIEATRRIVAGDTSAHVLVLTTVETDEMVHAALRAGAYGFLLKSVPREQLWIGIEAVAAGDALLAPSMTRRIIEQALEGSRRTPFEMALTDRQREVVTLVARGLSNKEIAEHLFLAETTVKGYVSEVLVKHHVRDRTQLVVLAYETGLVRPGELP